VVDLRIASVRWIPWSQRTEVVYDTGAPVRIVTSEESAASLAADAGLQPVGTDDGTRRWVRR